MSLYNPDDEEERSNGCQARSNPSRIGEKRGSKENSLDIQRWYSFKEELIRDRKDHSFSGPHIRGSAEASEQRIHSLILADKSNSELRSSIASRYVDYLDQYKRNFADLVKKAETDEHPLKEILKTRSTQVKEPNILLNSTILSNCFGDRSFHEPIHEISNEADFIEEGESASGDGSFFGDNPKEGFSKIYNNLEKEDFSFDNKKILSGLFEEINNEVVNMSPVRKPQENSFDTIENLSRIDQTYFFEKKPTLSQYQNTQTYDPEEEYIRIVHLPLNAGGSKVMEEHILTAGGLVGSKKNTRSRSLVLGRLSTDDDVRPNDIVLPCADLAISRVHCSVFFKQGFSSINRRIPRKFVTFLSGKYPKIAGANCKIRRLGRDVLARVYQFLKQPQKVYAVDLGSTTGTYKRIQQGQYWNIKMGDTFMVGNSVQIVCCLARRGHHSLGSIKQLFTFLAEETEERATIHGLTGEQLKQVELSREKRKSAIHEILKEGENDSFMKSGTCLEEDFPLPILILQLDHCPSSVKPTQIFICQEPEMTFNVGRDPSNDLSLNSRDISKVHLRIIYKDMQWSIADGSKRKASMNGTWVSLQDRREQVSKRFSSPVEISDGDQLKISENLLTFNLHNFK